MNECESLRFVFSVFFFVAIFLAENKNIFVIANSCAERKNNRVEFKEIKKRKQIQVKKKTHCMANVKRQNWMEKKQSNVALDVVAIDVLVLKINGNVSCILNLSIFCSVLLNFQKKSICELCVVLLLPVIQIQNMHPSI